MVGVYGHHWCLWTPIKLIDTSLSSLWCHTNNQLRTTLWLCSDNQSSQAFLLFLIGGTTATKFILLDIDCNWS